jgi:hypothetical protein
MQLHDLHCSKHYTDNEINEDEMGGACGKREREKKWVEGFVWATGSLETTWKRWARWDDNPKTHLKNRTEWDDVD